MVTSESCAAEQIKNDKVEDVATGGVQNENVWKRLARRPKFDEHRNERCQNWKKLDSLRLPKSDEERKRSGRREVVQVNRKRLRKTQS